MYPCEIKCETIASIHSDCIIKHHMLGTIFILLSLVAFFCTPFLEWISRFLTIAKKWKWNSKKMEKCSRWWQKGRRNEREADYCTTINVCQRLPSIEAKREILLFISHTDVMLMHVIRTSHSIYFLYFNRTYFSARWYYYLNQHGGFFQVKNLAHVQFCVTLANVRIVRSAQKGDEWHRWKWRDRLKDDRGRWKWEGEGDREGDTQGESEGGRKK